MFFCGFREISKNTFFTEHLWATASVSFSRKIPLKAKIIFKKNTSFQEGFTYSLELYLKRDPDTGIFL